MDSIPSGEEAPKEIAYSYDEGRLSFIHSLTEQAFHDATSYHDIATRIFETKAKQEDARVRAEIREVASIFYYRIDLERGVNSKPGATLEPLSEKGEAHFWPYPIQVVGPDTLKLWDALLIASTRPETQGLLADLLFSARYQKPHLNARRAVEAYVASQDGNFHQLHRSEMLVRSWSICRSLGIRDLEASVEDAMSSLVGRTLNSETSAPGTAFPLIRCLLEGRMRGKKGSKQAELHPKAVDYLFSAFDRYRADYLSLQLAHMARECLKDPALVDRALRKAAANLLESAEQATDRHVRTHRLEQAAKFARRFHLDDVHSECVRRLQATDPSTFQWITIRSASTLRASDVESYLRIFDQPHLVEALSYFFETPSPSGSRKQNEKLAKSILDASLTHRLIGTATYGTHGLPQKSFNTEEEKLQHQINGIETMALGAQGIILSAALDRMAEVHEIPPAETLHAWLVERYGSDPGLCMSLAESFSLYWKHDYTSCVQLAMPRVEAAIRSILLLLDEPIYRVEEDKSPGQFPGLGSMLPQLERNGFDPDWSSFIRALLLTPGCNLRNLGAHGFLQDVDRQTAALVIRALSVVALLAPEESSKKACDAQMIKQSLTTPTIRHCLSLLDRLLVKIASRLNAILAVRLGRERRCIPAKLSSE
ncbi:hypothetical protein ACWGPD_11615 [Streptomyces hirsutus]|uniref:hypothetical protein n=1 Tax=Streptomyces hirsutus TaxID=35620 RepID=UPI00362AAAF5